MADNIDKKRGDSDMDEEASTTTRSMSFLEGTKSYQPSAPKPLAPGILSIKFIEAAGLSIPGENGVYSKLLEIKHLQIGWKIYAILEYERLQEYVEVSVLAQRPTGKMPVKFEVSTPSELTVHLFAKSPDSSREPQDMPLGLARLNPFLGSGTSGRKWVELQYGTGRVGLEVSYSQQNTPRLEDKSAWQVINEISTTYLTHVRNRSTGRDYAMATVNITNTTPCSDGEQKNIQLGIQHPFIAPLTFFFVSPKILSLMSPLAGGGHLFYYLQRRRRLDVDAVILYAAKLVCAIEYLHDRWGIMVCLKLENILLDHFGHISLCNPAIFALNMDDRDRLGAGTPEYRAPETLTGEEISLAVDWWALGMFIYEMLTGLPPFYHKDPDKQRQLILGEALHIPKAVPLAASDIITRLLQKSPAKRLGANGASEVKSDAFFRDINWDGLLHSTTPFKPKETKTFFGGEPNQECALPIEKPTGLLAGFTLNGVDVGKLWDEKHLERTKELYKDSVYKPSSFYHDQEWELVWEAATEDFYFNNVITNEVSPARVSTAVSKHKIEPIAEDNSAVVPTKLPSESQKKDALAAALKAGHGPHLISQILHYGMDLNIVILNYDYRVDSGEPIWILDEIPVTPLEWAVEHDQVELVNLFLDNHADANVTGDETAGPALFRAARKGNNKIVEALIPRTNPVSATRALCLAIELEKASIVSTLLANGVSCNFAELAIPKPGNPMAYDLCTLGEGPSLGYQDFTPAIVRAARLGSIGIVKELLAHGADPNADYHHLCGLGQDRTGHRDTIVHAHFSCGRVVQIAMEKQHHDIVRLLIDNGADITLPPTIWKWHECSMVPRSPYLRVIAGLEEAAAAAATAATAKVVTPVVNTDL